MAEGKSRQAVPCRGRAGAGRGGGGVEPRRRPTAAPVRLREPAASSPGRPATRPVPPVRPSPPTTFAQAEALMRVSMTPAQRTLAAESWNLTIGPFFARRDFPLGDEAPGMVWNPVLRGTGRMPKKNQLVRSSWMPREAAGGRGAGLRPGARARAAGCRPPGLVGAVDRAGPGAARALPAPAQLHHHPGARAGAGRGRGGGPGDCPREVPRAAARHPLRRQGSCSTPPGSGPPGAPSPSGTACRRRTPRSSPGCVPREPSWWPSCRWGPWR